MNKFNIEAPTVARYRLNHGKTYLSSKSSTHLSLGVHLKLTLPNLQTSRASQGVKLVRGQRCINIAYSLDMLHLRVTEKAYFHLAKAFNTTLGLANAEEQTCELFIHRVKGAKKVCKKALRS